MRTILPTLNRRHAMGLGAVCLLSVKAWAGDAGKAADHPGLAALEKRAGGRLGVAMLNTETGAIAGHRLSERFGMCSTFKLPLAAAILRKVDEGSLRLDQWVPYSQADMVSHAPVTGQHLAKGGMTVAAMARATQTTSDNPAANLLMRLLGGPSGFTAMLRTAGDAETRVDRLEPDMNLVPLGELRDTTTPLAMAQTMALMLTQGWLSPASTKLLIEWMEATETGSKRLRAGFPAGWRSGDKTGTAMADGMVDKYNDTAIAWAPGKAPLIVTAYYDAAMSFGKGIRDEDQAVLAQVGRIAANWYLGV